jgi:hypothetical protein
LCPLTCPLLRFLRVFHSSNQSTPPLPLIFLLHTRQHFTCPLSYFPCLSRRRVTIVLRACPPNLRRERRHGDYTLASPLHFTPFPINHKQIQALFLSHPILILVGENRAPLHRPKADDSPERSTGPPSITPVQLVQGPPSGQALVQHAPSPSPFSVRAYEDRQSRGEYDAVSLYTDVNHLKVRWLHSFRESLLHSDFTSSSTYTPPFELPSGASSARLCSAPAVPKAPAVVPVPVPSFQAHRLCPTNPRQSPSSPLCSLSSRPTTHHRPPFSRPHSFRFRPAAHHVQASSVQPSATDLPPSISRRPFAHPRHANLPPHDSAVSLVDPPSSAYSAARLSSAVQSCTYLSSTGPRWPSPAENSSIHAPLIPLCSQPSSCSEALALRLAIFDISPPQGLYIPGPAIPRLRETPLSLTDLTACGTHQAPRLRVHRQRPLRYTLKLGPAH